MTALASKGAPEPPLAPATGIQTVAADLAGIRDRMEVEFVAIGNGLMSSATRLNRVTEAFAALPIVLQGDDMLAASARLGQLGAKARGIEGAFLDEQRNLDLLAGALNGASQPVSDLRRAAKTMSIVAINARVIAAGISGGNERFDVFTSDIARFSSAASATIAMFSRTHEELSSAVREAVAARRAFRVDQSDDLADLACRLETRLAEMDAQRASTAQSTGATEQATRQIGRRISAIVAALQVGDATRQRIEHIEQALATATAIECGETTAERQPDAAARGAVVAAILGLQHAQLTGAFATFDADLCGAKAELAGLVADAEDAISRNLSLYGRDAGGGAALAGLGEEVRRTIDRLRRFEAERRKLDAMTSTVITKVRGLLDAVEKVRDVEAGMRLVSLNAAVRCAQLGTRARALNTITQQLRELTGETVIAADRAMMQLTAAESVAVSLAEAANSASAAQLSELEATATGALDLLDLAETRLRRTLATLAGEAPAIMANLRAASGRIAVHAEMAEQIADIDLRLVGLAAAGAPDGTPNAQTEQEVAKALAALRANYTMEEERRIHGEQAGDGSDFCEDQSGSASEPDGNDLDDFLL